MKVKLNGTRGSVGRAGPDTVRYGGDTSSIEVMGDDGSSLILDAGSGVVHAEASAMTSGRLDVLLTHLHMDHIQGLGFFRPLFEPDVDVHMWGPVSTTKSLTARLSRYLSPPLFPVRLRDLPSVTLHDLAPGTVEIGSFTVTAEFVIHPGQTFGYRVEGDDSALTYLPDHEPALGLGRTPSDPRWTSGFALAHRADVLIHDAQYTNVEYPDRVGWGHSTLEHAVDFAEMTDVGRLVTFHHEPGHSDEEIDRHHGEVAGRRNTALPFAPGLAGLTLSV
ncbi:MAG TPA: MBL fold metallo-hydrolase [Acidimicrobiia bacterium]